MTCRHIISVKCMKFHIRLVLTANPARPRVTCCPAAAAAPAAVAAVHLARRCRWVGPKGSRALHQHRWVPLLLALDGATLLLPTCLAPLPLVAAAASASVVLVQLLLLLAARAWRPRLVLARLPPACCQQGIAMAALTAADSATHSCPLPLLLPQSEMVPLRVTFPHPLLPAAALVAAAGLESALAPHPYRLLPQPLALLLLALLRPAPRPHR